MYSRSFSNERTEAPRPPENYNGTAFLEAPNEKEEARTTDTEICMKGIPQREDLPREKEGLFSGILGSAGLKTMFSKFGLPHFAFPKIGTEEILLIAACAYLFFSKEGDKECAFILLFLLFVN
jgi:hypothetical protein